MQALNISELCMPSDDKDIDSPSCCHGNHPHPEIKFRKIMKHHEIKFDIQCSLMVDRMKLFICYHGTGQTHLATKINKKYFLGQEVSIYQI